VNRQNRKNCSSSKILAKWNSYL